MKPRYRVTAEHPTWQDAGTTTSVFSKGDVVWSRNHHDAADHVDGDGDVYLVNERGTEGYVQFSQLEYIGTDAATIEAATDTYTGAHLRDAAERLGLVAELQKLTDLVALFKQVEAAVAEMKASGS